MKEYDANVDSTDDQQLSPEAAQRLYQEGGFLVVTQLPPGTEFGIDLYSWNTGEKFLGVKMIPPGIHFVYYSTLDQGTAGPQLSPRTGFACLCSNTIKLHMSQASSTCFVAEKYW